MACIYCNHKEQTTQTVRELMASLLKQLVQGHPVVSEWIRTLYYKHYPNGTSPSIRELTETLRKEVGSRNKVFVIVDALDELVERDRGYLISQVQSLGNAVKLMVTSRPLSSIGRFFGNARSIDIRADNQDVREFVKHRILLMSHFSLVVETDGTLCEDIMDKIGANVRGMYVRPFML
jgi:sulfur relay (sulfurtransferase) DsrC/TusE family protein